MSSSDGEKSSRITSWFSKILPLGCLGALRSTWRLPQDDTNGRLSIPRSSVGGTSQFETYWSQRSDTALK